MSNPNDGKAPKEKKGRPAALQAFPAHYQKNGQERPYSPAAQKDANGGQQMSKKARKEARKESKPIDTPAPRGHMRTASHGNYSHEQKPAPALQRPHSDIDHKGKQRKQPSADYLSPVSPITPLSSGRKGQEEHKGQPGHAYQLRSDAKRRPHN